MAGEEAWIPAIAEIGSQIMGNASAKADWYYHNTQQFTERMASTQHQREIADLQKAGLNPILSAGGAGASAPAGSIGSPLNPVQPGTISSALSSAKDMQLTDKQMDLVTAQTNTAKADQILKLAQANKANADAGAVPYTIKNTEKSTGKTEQEIKALKEQLAELQSRGSFWRKVKGVGKSIMNPSLLTNSAKNTPSAGELWLKKKKK